MELDENWGSYVEMDKIIKIISKTPETINLLKKRMNMSISLSIDECLVLLYGQRNSQDLIGLHS